MNEHNHIGYFPLISICRDNDKSLGELVNFKNASIAGGISPLRQVNFFIGGNNAGKSRTIRGLFHAIQKGEKFAASFSSEKAAIGDFFAQKYKAEQAFYKQFLTAIQNPVWETIKNLEAYFRELSAAQYNRLEPLEKIKELQDILINYKQRIEENSSQNQIGIDKSVYDEVKYYAHSLFVYLNIFKNSENYIEYSDFKRYLNNNDNKFNYVDKNSLLRQIQGWENVYNTLNELKAGKPALSPQWIQSEDGTKFFQQIKTLCDALLQIKPVLYGGEYSTHNCKEALKNLITTINQNIQTLQFTAPRLYIPVLRSMRTLGDADYYLTKDYLDKQGFQIRTMQDIHRISEQDFYKLRIWKDYKIGADEIFTGLAIYKDLRASLLGTHAQRELVREFEKLLSKEFFNNESITLTPRVDADVVYVRIGEKEEMPIYNLGDGIQAIIILIFPLFMRKHQPTAVFIEEPEMHLHPKFQRVFMEILRREFPMHQFFITTHSNIYINRTDASIFRVWQESNNDKICLEYMGGEKMELLAELGYRPSDVLQPNYLLWVEGESDKHYMKLFIETLAPDLCEGEHYHIVSYGGCTILKHLSYDNFNSINSSFGFVVDRDKKVDKLFECKNEIVEKATQAKKFAWITTHTEIENYFGIDDFKKAVSIVHRLPIERIQLAAESEKTPQAGDFCKYTDSTRPDEQAKIDKILVAKEIYKQRKGNFSIDATTELHEKIEKLVEAIRAANQINESPTT